MHFLDQKSLQATVVKLYWRIKAQINLKEKKDQGRALHSFAAVQWLGLHASPAGDMVRSMVRGPRSHRMYCPLPKKAL